MKNVAVFSSRSAPLYGINLKNSPSCKTNTRCECIEGKGCVSLLPGKMPFLALCFRSSCTLTLVCNISSEAYYTYLERVRFSEGHHSSHSPSRVHPPFGNRDRNNGHNRGGVSVPGVGHSRVPCPPTSAASRRVRRWTKAALQSQLSRLLRDLCSGRRVARVWGVGYARPIARRERHRRRQLSMTGNARFTGIRFWFDQSRHGSEGHREI